MGEQRLTDNELKLMMQFVKATKGVKDIREEIVKPKVDLLEVISKLIKQEETKEEIVTPASN